MMIRHGTSAAMRRKFTLPSLPSVFGHCNSLGTLLVLTDKPCHEQVSSGQMRTLEIKSITFNIQLSIRFPFKINGRTLRSDFVVRFLAD